MIGVVVLIVVAVPLDAAVDDPFQEGEYAIWSAVRAAAPDAPTPVLIHGALDILPSWIAARACRDDRQLGCVRGVNAGLELGVGGLVVALLAVLAGLGSGAAVAATLPAMLLIGVLGASATSPVAAQHGTPGVRDLALLAGLLLMALIARGDGGRRSGLWLGLGALTAAAPLWSYNRGLALVGVAGVFTLACCAVGRSLRPALLAGAGALVLLGALFAAGLLPAMRGTLSDIAYWSRNTAIWASPADLRDGAAASLVHAAALAFAVPAAWSAWRAGRRGPALIALPLAMTAALYLIQAANRPDAEHLRWTLWPSVLLLATGIATRMRHQPTASTVTLSRLAAVVTTLSALLLAPQWPAQWQVGPGLAANARLAWTGLPTDRALAGPSLMQAADVVRTGGGCTFAASNAGLIHLLSGVFPCSRFWFGVYVAADEQAGVIAELEAARPRFILWSARGWWARIDGRGFADRSPALAAWIVANYPVMLRAGDDVLRTGSPQ
jgi:hypothetical protein